MSNQSDNAHENSFSESDITPINQPDTINTKENAKVNTRQHDDDSHLLETSNVTYVHHQTMEMEEGNDETLPELILVEGKEVIIDMLYMLEGIKTKYINQVGYKFTKMVTSILPMMNEISELHCKLLDIKKNIIPIGFIQKAIQITLDTLINEYDEYLSHVDMELHDNESDVTVLVMYKHALYCKDYLKVLNEIMMKLTGIIEVMNTMMGEELPEGGVLTYLYKQSKSPNSIMQALSTRFLVNCSQPVYKMLYDWVSQGMFDDPQRDFFLIANKKPTLLSNTLFVTRNVPIFLETVKNDIKFIGEALLFFKQEGENVDDIVEMVENKESIFTYNSNELIPLLHAMNHKAHMKAITLITERYTPLIHIQNIKDYILLFKGDFANELISSVIQTLRLGITMNQSLFVTHFISALNITGGDVKEVVCHINPDGIKRVEEGIDIKYKLSEPLQFIITHEHEKLYNDCFKYLWKLKSLIVIIEDMFRTYSQYFIVTSDIDSIPMYLHKYSRELRQHLSFLESIEEYSYIAMDNCYKIFEDNWNKATDLYSLSQVHGNYIESIAKVLFVIDNEVGAIVTSIIDFIFKIIDKMNVFNHVIDDALNRIKQSGKSTELINDLNSEVTKVDGSINLEIESYDKYYSMFYTALSQLDNKEIRFLLRKLIAPHTQISDDGNAMIDN